MRELGGLFSPTLDLAKGALKKKKYNVSLRCVCVNFYDILGVISSGVNEFFF